MFLLDVMVGWFHVLLCFSCGGPFSPQKKTKCLSVCLVMAVCFSFRLDDQLELFLYPCNSGSYTPDFLLLIPKNDGFYKVSPWKHRYLFSIPIYLYVKFWGYSCHDDKARGVATSILTMSKWFFQVQVFVGMKCEVLNQSCPPSGIEQRIKSLRVKNCCCPQTLFWHTNLAFFNGQNFTARRE